MIHKPLVIVDGRVQQLPVGDSLEEADMAVFSKRVDFIGDTLMYKGEAIAGTPESSPLWRISRIDLANDGDVSETWAEGAANFNKIWTSRLSYSYS